MEDAFVNRLRERFRKKRWITSVQLDPFERPTPAFVKTLLGRLRKIGIRFVDINTSSHGVRQDALQMASGIEILGFTTIPHITPRDGLRDAVLSQILGAYTWGSVRNVLVIGGDPRKELSEPFASRGGVYETDSAGLIRSLAGLRKDRGLDLAIGCAFSQSAETRAARAREEKRLREKLAAGADFVMTQPLFWHPGWKDDLAYLREAIPVPFLVGLWLFFDMPTIERVQSGRISGVVLPDAAYRILQENPKRLAEIQAPLYAEMIEEMRQTGIAGVYIVPPFRERYYAPFIAFRRGFGSLR